MSALDDKIHRIATDVVDTKLESVHTAIDTVTKQGATTALDVKAIATKVDAMYGNGSGRIGILDEIKAEQKIVKQSITANEEESVSFRFEVRAFMDRQNRKTKFAWVNTKWILGGIAFISWELFKIKVLKR